MKSHGCRKNCVTAGRQLGTRSGSVMSGLFLTNLVFC
jgi:hypothetical protein